MQYKFKNGTVVTGELEEILKIAKVFNEEVNLKYYQSSSKSKKLLIKDMDTNHIQNALLLFTRNYFDYKNFEGLSVDKFIDKYTGLVNTETVKNLYQELESRCSW